MAQSGIQGKSQQSSLQGPKKKKSLERRKKAVCWMMITQWTRKTLASSSEASCYVPIDYIISLGIIALFISGPQRLCLPSSRRCIPSGQ